MLIYFRALDVDVDNPQTGRASLVAIAKAAGVRTPLVTYEQVSSAAVGASSRVLSRGHVLRCRATSRWSRFPPSDDAHWFSSDTDF